MAYMSRLNSGLVFDTNEWVVSVVNTGGGSGGKLLGHSAIIVEGLETDYPGLKQRLFVGFYDIRFTEHEEIPPNHSWLSSWSSNVNIKGYISRVTVNEKNHYTPEIDYSRYQARRGPRDFPSKKDKTCCNP